MFRLIAFLTLLPSLAAADWSARPSMFTYEATFDLCTVDPTDPDLAANCLDALNAAYALKRAVARAYVTCFPESLTTCALPFEDEGLPAIAARIAVDAGCEATDVQTMANDESLSPDHCISIASDIMIDEGVVPLDTTIACGVHWIECGDIAYEHASLWITQIEAMFPDDQTIETTQLDTIIDCNVQAREVGGALSDLAALECIACRSADLWADLTLNITQDQ